MKIVIAGSNGFVGKHLATYFQERGHELVLLSRHPNQVNSYFWDPEKKQVDLSLLEGAEVVINLCGESVFGRWTEAKKQAIINSRVVPTQFLSECIFKLTHKPKVFINASAVGYYGHRGEEILIESSPPGQDFLATSCILWEEAAAPLKTILRLVYARFGVVFGRDGGALKLLLKVFQSGMGGVLGTGEQMMSWIAIDDLCAAMDYVIEHPTLEGPINFVSKEAVSNRTLTETIGRILQKPTVMSVPKFLLNTFLGEGAAMFLDSAHVKPVKLEESGFKYQLPTLEYALKKYLLTNTSA